MLILQEAGIGAGGGGGSTMLEQRGLFEATVASIELRSSVSDSRAALSDMVRSVTEPTSLTSAALDLRNGSARRPRSFLSWRRQWGPPSVSVKKRTR